MSFMLQNVAKLLLLTLGLSIASCATEKPITSLNTLVAGDLNSKTQSSQPRPKIDHFEIILNSNDSMADPYMGRRKFDIAKDIAGRINQAIPDAKLTGVLRTFGLDFKTGKATMLVYGPAAYSRSDLESSLGKVAYPLGDSSLDVAVDAAHEDLRSAKGRKAIIIISDGKEKNDSSLAAVRRIKKAFGKRLCLYTVQVGNSAAGKTFLEKVARAGGCGFYSPCDQLVSGSGVADFVEKVFLTSKPPELKKSAAVPTIPPPELPPASPDKMVKEAKSETTAAETAGNKEGKVGNDWDRYIIGPEDVLNIYVWREESLSKTVPVRMDGKISLPLVDDIQAEGLTPLQLKELLTKRFTDLINHPTISITVIEANSFKVHVLGEVKSPGVYRIKNRTTFLQLIAMSGGFTEWADQKKVLIIRKEKGAERRFFVNYKKIIDGEASDIDILRDDTVVVQ
jgi:protein involved in polysaccharide export with SLBB domain